MLSTVACCSAYPVDAILIHSLKLSRFLTAEAYPSRKNSSAEFLLMQVDDDVLVPCQALGIPVLTSPH